VPMIPSSIVDTATPTSATMNEKNTTDGPTNG
jgi:hypothetical protein